MDFPAALFPGGLLIVSHLLLWGLVLWCVLTAEWWRLKEVDSCTILLAMTVVMLGLWQIKAQMPTGLNLHLLGAAILALMFRWQFAILSLVLIQIIDCIHAQTSISGLGVNGLMTAVLPVLLAYGIAYLVRRFLPTHFFVYVFVSCFWGPALMIILTGLASTSLLLLATAFNTQQLLPDYLMAYVLLAFPEAFLTGMGMTLLIVYKPQWVSTFHDEVYLHGK